MGNKKNEGSCKICCCPVKKGKGLRCCGACRCWYHFKCLNYSKKKIKAIKCGVLKIECPCPDCCTDDSSPPDPSDSPPCSDRPCCCKNKFCPPCEIPNLEDDDCVIEIVCKNPCEMLMDAPQCPSPCPRIRQPPPPPRPRYQSVKINDNTEQILPYCEDDSRSEASVDEVTRYRKPPYCPPRKICFPDVKRIPEPDWRDRCCPPKPKCPTPMPVLSRVPSRESRISSNPDWRDRCCPPKPKPIIISKEPSREQIRDTCQEWRDRCCPQKIPKHNDQIPNEPDTGQDWRSCPKPQPMPILCRVPSREKVKEQEWRDRCCPASQMPQPQREPSGQDWRDRCCPKQKPPDPPEPPAPTPPSPPLRAPCQDWRERCCPKQKTPETKPPPPPRTPCQEWREHCCPKPKPPEPPPPRDTCQEWREQCCPKPKPPEPPPPREPCQEWRNRCCPSKKDLPDSIVIELNSDKPSAPNPECKNPCCTPKMCKNICKPKPEEDKCVKLRRQSSIEDVIRLVCKEVMDQGTVTTRKKKPVRTCPKNPVETCIKCHQPKPQCKCQNNGDESVTADDTVENGDDDTNGDETETLDTDIKNVCDILIQDTDGAETLSLNAVEKMCKTVGKLALQMNDLMEKLRRSVTHTKESVVDVAKKDCGCPMKKRGVKIYCPNKTTTD